MRAVMRFLVPLFVVLVVAFAGLSRAQVGADGVKSQGLSFQRIGGITGADSLGRVLKMDASGNAKVVDADRDRDLWGVYNLINNQLTASGSGMADSNATPVATYNFRRTGLMFYAQFDSLSSEVKIAVQVRAHYSSATDSASAFPWYRWPVRSTTVASDVDSLGHMTKGTYAQAQITTANVAQSSGGLWSGEFIVKFQSARQDTVDGISAGKYGAYPKGIYIPLQDIGGNYYWAPYTSVRVRVLSGVKSRFRIRTDLVGSAQ